MSRTNWKVFERKVAKDLNTARVLQKGRAVPDILISTKACDIVVECKARASLSPYKVLSEMAECNLDRSPETAYNINILCWRKNNAKNIFVYLKTSSLIALLSYTSPVYVQKTSWSSNPIVVVDYLDFVDLVLSYVTYMSKVR